MTRSTALASIHQAKDAGFFNVVFTGGEATTRWKDLLACIAEADRLGLPTRLVTNAYWATSPGRAQTKVAALSGAGLKEINFSTGTQHARFIPPDRVVLAAIAAAVAGIRSHIMVELHPGARQVSAQAIAEHPLMAEQPSHIAELITVFQSPWMPMDPWTRSSVDGHTARQDNLYRFQGCESVLQTYVVDTEGEVASCCGLGMRAIPELHLRSSIGAGGLQSAVVEAEADVMKLLLRYKGPEQILAWAAGRDPSIDWEGRYSHRCQACLRVYKDQKVKDVIRRHINEAIQELLETVILDEELLHLRPSSPVTPGSISMANSTLNF